MSKVLDKATAHFRNKISGDMRKIRVPEWDCDIYVRQSATLREESKVLELSQQGKTVEALVESLIAKCRNEDGTKMFNIADKAVLMNEVDPAVLIRVAGEVNGIQESVEAAEKN